MIDDTIGKIEKQIANTGTLDEDRRQALLELFRTLKSEVAALSRTDREQAQSIAAFVEISTQQATRVRKDPNLLRLSLEGLAASVHGFEESHPQLVQLVNGISQTLSNLGI